MAHYPSGRAILVLALLGISWIPSASRAAEENTGQDLKSAKYWLDSAAQQASSVKRQERDFVSFPALLAMAQCNAGDTAAALAIADGLLDGAKNDSTQFGVYDRLAAASIRIAAGRNAQAILILKPLEKEMIALIPDPHVAVLRSEIQEDYAMENIAIQYARMGDFDHAKNLVEEIDIRQTRAAPRCTLAHLMFIDKKPDEASRLLELSNQQVRQEKEAGDRPDIFREISAELAYEGNFEAAFKYADAVTDFEKSGALENVVTAMYRAGQAEPSRKMAERIWKVIDAGPDRAWAGDLESLASAQFDAGDIEGIKQTIDHLQSRPKPLMAEEQVRLYFLQASIAARAGDSAECRRLTDAASAIEPPADWLWWEVGCAYVQAGKIDEAMAAAHEANPKGVDYRIALEMTRHGFITKAVASLDKEAPSSRATLSRTLAKEGMRHGDTVEVNKWITSIDEPACRAWADLGAGEGLNKTDADLGIIEPPQMLGF